VVHGVEIQLDVNNLYPNDKLGKLSLIKESDSPKIPFKYLTKTSEVKEYDDYLSEY
jgi:hypothetical protein